MVFSEKFALFANSVAYFSWIIFFNSIFKWLKPRLIENNLILAKNPKNQCLKFSDFSTKSGSVVKGLVILKLNVPNFGPFYYLCYFSTFLKRFLLHLNLTTNFHAKTAQKIKISLKLFQTILGLSYFSRWLQPQSCIFVSGFEYCSIFIWIALAPEHYKFIFFEVIWNWDRY